MIIRETSEKSVSGTQRESAPGHCRMIYLCQGRDCRKKKKPGRALRELLNQYGEVQEVNCQKICHGPVMGIEFNGRLEWFGRLASKKARKNTEKLLVEGAISRVMMQRRAGKRSGRFRGTQTPSVQ